MKDAFSVVDIKPQRLKRLDDEAASDPAETPGNSGSENEADNLGLASAAVAQAGGDSPKRIREQSAGLDEPQAKRCVSFHGGGSEQLGASCIYSDETTFISSCFC